MTAPDETGDVTDGSGSSDDARDAIGAGSIVAEDVDVAYGDLQVLWNVSLEVSESDRIVALVGPNGAGKTTLLKTLSGLLQPTSGRVELFGTDSADLSPSEVVRRGFVHVPEARNLFGEMSVEENLQMGAYTERGSYEETLDDVYETFPVLEDRADQAAGTLSGGEQQMLAIGRGLMARPRVLALDELSVGLAPQLTQRVFEKVETLSEDVTVLLTEQHVNEALELADRALLLENGRIVAKGGGTELLESEHIRDAYLRA